jgi:hypothetical protein
MKVHKECTNKLLLKIFLNDKPKDYKDVKIPKTRWRSEGETDRSA